MTRFFFLLPWLLSPLSGVITALALSPWDSYLGGWLGLIPVLMALLLFRNAGPTKEGEVKGRIRGHLVSIGLGLLFGVVHAAIIFSWLLSEGRLGEFAMNLVAYGFSMAVWGWFVSRTVELPAPVRPVAGKRVEPILPGYGSIGWSSSIANLSAALGTAAAWTFLEWGRGTLVPGWNFLGVALQNNLALAQVLPVAGPSGLSFIAVFVNLIAFTTVRRIILEPGRMTWASRFDFTATMGALLLIALAGFLYLRQKPGGGSVKVAMVANPSSQARLMDLTRAATTQKPGLVVWLRTNPEQIDFPALEAEGIGRTAALLTGTAAEGASTSGCRIILPGAVKSVVVPTGNTPFFALGGISSERSLNPFQFGDVTWLPLLNRDAGDQVLIRSAAKRLVQGFVALVDAFPVAAAGQQQLKTNLRGWCVSVGNPLVFASSKGGYLLADANGALVQAIAPTERDIMKVGDLNFAAPSSLTLYARYGDWLAIGSGILCLFLIFRTRLMSRYAQPRRLAS
jgi:apolipoprotein N-acyltransferase